MLNLPNYNMAGICIALKLSYNKKFIGCIANELLSNGLYGGAIVSSTEGGG